MVTLLFDGGCFAAGLLFCLTGLLCCLVTLLFDGGCFVAGPLSCLMGVALLQSQCLV